MRIVIAEDSVLLREGLTRLLAEAGHDVVAAAGEAEDFLREVGRHQPDVVVVDVRMPPTFTDEGLRAALVVRGRWPDVAVLVLSQYVEERYATELLSDRVKGKGGVGYLLKDRVADLAEFLDALDRGGGRGQRAGPRGEIVPDSPVAPRSPDPADSVTWPCSLAEGSGDIAASGLDGGSVRLSDDSGDITTSGLSGRDVTISDSSGDIFVTGLAGTMVTSKNDSGDITLTFTKVPQRVDVTDGSGDITLVLPSGPAACQVHARSASGDVSDTVNNRPSSRNEIIASDGSGDITISY